MICNLCPRQCGADRSTPQGLKRSICHASDDIEVALVSLHAWEEPILESKKGAGTIFFFPLQSTVLLLSKLRNQCPR